MPNLNPNRSTAFLARMITALFFVGGVSATLLMANISAKRHEAEVSRIFHAECEAMRSAITRQLDLFFDVLASIGQLHELSDQITREDFEEFTSKGMLFQKRILSVYGFVQRMPHDIRAALAEKPAGGLIITEPDRAGRFVAAGVRPEYFPLVYQNPEGALAFPLGADLSAFPGVSDSIIRMNQRNSPVVAHSLRLQGKDGMIGYFAFSPLYQRMGDGAANLSGFTISILWPQDILERALADVATRDVLVRFYDPEIVPDQDEDATDATALQVTADIQVADRTWRFHARPADEYLDARNTILPSVIMLAGGLITVLSTATLMLLSNRTHRIEKVVTERTRDLKHANELLSEAMHDRMRLEREILDISEREKQQLGHDLHDSLGQKLTGAVFLSRALSGHLGESSDETRTQVTRITEILKDSVAQVRRMARGLSPVELGHDGLSGALHRLAEETSSVYGISCLFHQTDEQPHPPAKAAPHLYAIALESVNNAIKHGHAREVVIELSRTPDQSLLIIEDDGAGFDSESKQTGGMGLRIMKYRATMIGGTLDISRRPIGGMKITCSFPNEEPVKA